MTATLVNTAVTAMVAALQSAPAVCESVERGRRRAVSQDHDMAIVVRPVQSEVTQDAMAFGTPVLWLTSVAVECYARSGANVAADLAVDPLIDAAYARLLLDPTLGGTVVLIKPQGIGYDFDADGQQVTCATLVFHIVHRTQGNTLG